MSTFVPANELQRCFLQACELIKEHFSHPTETITNHQLQNSSCRVKNLGCKKKRGKKIPSSVCLVLFLLIQLNSFYQSMEDANWPVLCKCLGGNKIVFRWQSVIEEQLRKHRKLQQGESGFVTGKSVRWKRISISCCLLSVYFEAGLCCASKISNFEICRSHSAADRSDEKRPLTGEVSAFRVHGAAFWQLVLHTWDFF